MIPFEGRQAFDQFCKEMMAKHKKDRDRYQVKASRRKAWEIAVSATEEALPKTRLERQQTYTFVYEPTVPAPLSNGVAVQKRKYVKRKSQPVDETSDDAAAASPVPSSPPCKRMRGNRSSPRQLADQFATQFVVFCQKRRDSVREANPSDSEAQVEGRLLELWEELDDDDRAKFIPMGADVTNIAEMMSKSVGGELAVFSNLTVKRSG